MNENELPVDHLCGVCGRRLLPGERANPYVTPGGEQQVVCELCKGRAEASGWLRPDEASMTSRARGPRRKRQRGALMDSFRKRAESGLGRSADERREQRERDRSSRRGGGGAGDETSDRRAVPDKGITSETPEVIPPEASTAGPDVQEALRAFNGTENRRTVAGLSRSLGEPTATAIAVRTASGHNGARITVAWELAWYQWEVGPGKRGPEIRQVAKGERPDQLRAADRNWNLVVAKDGTLARRSAEDA